MFYLRKKLLQDTQLQPQTRPLVSPAEVMGRLITTVANTEQHRSVTNKFKCFSLLVVSIASIDGATVNISARAAASEAVLAADNNSLTLSNDPDRLSGESGDMSEIVGKWVWTRTGNSAVSTSGVHLGSNGSRFTYQFMPNGTVKFTGMMNVMSGACNQQIFQFRTGKAYVNGSTMTIDWSPERFTRDFSCDSSHNYTKIRSAENKTYQVRLRTDIGQKQLCITDKDETCFSLTN